MKNGILYVTLVLRSMFDSWILVLVLVLPMVL